MSVSREDLQKAQENSAGIIARIEAARARGDEEEVKSILASQEYKETYMQTKNVWQGIVDAVAKVARQYINAFSKVIKQMKKSEVYQILKEEERERQEKEKRVTHLSHKKSKSQRKNWSKWKKRK